MNEDDSGQMQGSPILYYDGVCGLCNRMIRWLIAADRGAVLRYASLQSESGLSLLSRHPGLRDEDTAILWELLPNGSERIAIKSRIPITLRPYLRGMPRMFLSIFAFLPRGLGDAVYDRIARSRYRIFGKYDTCPIPEPAVRSRFLS